MMNNRGLLAVNPYSPQRGSVLLVSLIILLVMTLIGVAGMNTSVMEQRMAGNMQDKEIAFEAAEEALQLGEAFLRGRDDLPQSSDSPVDGQVFERNYLNNEYGNNWWSSARAREIWDTAVVVPTYASLASAAAPYVVREPRYLIEESILSKSGDDLGVGKGDADKDEGKQFHRVTACACGAKPTTVVVLQTTFMKRYEPEAL